MQKSKLVIGVGSNINAIQSLRRALHLVKQVREWQVCAVASIYESDALLPKDAPNDWNISYLNSAILVELIKPLSNEQILERLKNIEVMMGRVSIGKWSPRVIDLDILYRDGCLDIFNQRENQYKSEDAALKINVPHAELVHRPFALLPLLEVYSDLFSHQKFVQIYIQNNQWLNNALKELSKYPNLVFDSNNKALLSTHISKKYIWPELVAILNITPDSFSDGGNLFLEQNRDDDVLKKVSGEENLLKEKQYLNYLKKTCDQLIIDGADKFDVGAESTRPGSLNVDVFEEIRRLKPVLKFLKKNYFDYPISLDSRKLEIWKEFITEIDFINDVEGFNSYEKINLLTSVKNEKLKSIIMHSLCVPPRKDMHLNESESVFVQLGQWWKNKKQDLLSSGVDLNNIYFDIGIGFGKTIAQSYKLITHLENFRNEDVREPMYIGISRKSFLKDQYAIQSNEDADRATYEMTQKINLAYCQQLRVHNVSLNRRAVRFNNSILKLSENLKMTSIHLEFKKTVNHLEKLNIMPKTMPGLEKLKLALSETNWFQSIDEKKVIVIAGTNGKGSTAAALESLLLSAGKSVGLYTSPHLIQTTERTRVNQVDMSEADFVTLFEENKTIIEKYELTHFESLTLMAANYFFEKNNLDYVIFEVGLGGTFDATNVFPHFYSVITSLSLDHQNILGHSLIEIAKNKFGIIRPNSLVIHHSLPDEVKSLFADTIRVLNAKSVKAKPYSIKSIAKQGQIEPNWFVDSEFGQFEINLPGERAAENVLTALTLFQELGYLPSQHVQCLNMIKWPGRMQKVNWPNKKYNLYLSGDHNEKGMTSLVKIIKEFKFNELTFVVGVGVDKACDEMFNILFKEFPNAKYYLTETPFKGRTESQYPDFVKEKAILFNNETSEILNTIHGCENDLVVVTGSLYLVGKVLAFLR